MKILILGFAKIKYMPYLNFYFDSIDMENNEVHILYWNRDLNEEDLTKYRNCIFHEFRYYQEDDSSKIKKIKSFLNYRRYAKKIIKVENFDFIFVLHSLPGVLLSGILKRKYKGRYVFDYRDFTYENFALFKKIVATITRNSYATFVSSDGFRRFLPNNCNEKIYTSHNLLLDSLNHRNEKKVYGISSDKIRIAFWGFIRNEKINKEIIKKISEDKRFELHYYGREQQTAINLKKYVEELNAENIFFHGEYKPEDRYKFVLETDIIHNYYFDENVKFAMGNKFYDGAIFYIPQICAENTYMGKCLNEYKIGLTCNVIDDNFTEKIYQYYLNLDFQSFYKNCDRFLNNVINEYEKGVNKIKEIFYKA